MLFYTAKVLKTGLGLAASVHFVKYAFTDDYSGVKGEFEKADPRFDPTVFLSLDLDYGAWVPVEALHGLDLRMGLRLPLRDVFYMASATTSRVMLSLGYEY